MSRLGVQSAVRADRSTLGRIRLSCINYSLLPQMWVRGAGAETEFIEIDGYFAVQLAAAYKRRRNTAIQAFCQRGFSLTN